MPDPLSPSNDGDALSAQGARDVAARRLAGSATAHPRDITYPWASLRDWFSDALRPERIEQMFMGLGTDEPFESIRAPAVRLGKDVYEGTTHGTAADKGLDKHGDAIWNAEHGFMTSTARFVTPEEAAEIALMADQLKQTPEGGRLGTHDLRDEIQRALPANENVNPREQFIEEYDRLVRQQAAEENRRDFRIVPPEDKK